MEIITTSSNKSVPLTTESPIFTTEFRPMDAGNRGHTKKLKSIPSSMEHDAALKALTRASSSKSIRSLENNRPDNESVRVPRPPTEAAIPEKLLENIRMVGRTRKANAGESEDEEEGTDPPGRFSKPVDPIKNFVRSQYARPSLGGPRNFNRSRMSSVGSEGRNPNGGHTPKPPSSVRTLTKEYTKSLAEAMSNLTDSEREPTQRWNLPKNNLDTSDEGVDMLTSRSPPESSYYSATPVPKAQSIRGGNVTLNKELGRLEKALTDVENAPNGSMAHGWSKLKSNLAVATRINASDRVRDMAVAAASAALIRKSMMAEPTKVPDIVKEMAHAAATAAAKKKKTMNEKELDVASPRTLKAVRPPSSRTLPPDEKPVSSAYLPPNDVSITTSVRSILPGIRRGTGSDLSGSEEQITPLRSALRNGSYQSGSQSSIEDDDSETKVRRIPKIEKNITAIMSNPVDGDTILGVPSQISDPCYAAVRTPHQRLAEQTTAAAQVRRDAIRERKEAFDILREGGTLGGKDTSGPLRSSTKADEVVKRLTNPAAFTGISKVRFDESAQPKQATVVSKKPPSNSNKMDFFSTFHAEEGPKSMRRNVSASMNTLNVLPKQIPGAKPSSKKPVSGSDELSTPKFVNNVRSDDLHRQKVTAASSSVDTLRTRRSSSNETNRVLNRSDDSLKSGRKGGKSGSNSIRGSSESLQNATDGAFGMHNRYWPAEEAESKASLEDEEAAKLEKRRRKKDAKESASRLQDKSSYTGVHRFGSTNRLAAPGRSPWNVI